MLNTLKAADFSNRVGETFKLALGDHQFSAKLRSVSDLTRPDPEDEDRRQPFSLIFRVDSEVELPQGIYSLAHDEVDSFEAFLVPIGEHEKGYDLEAVFN